MDFAQLKKEMNSNQAQKDKDTILLNQINARMLETNFKERQFKNLSAAFITRENFPDLPEIFFDLIASLGVAAELRSNHIFLFPPSLSLLFCEFLDDYKNADISLPIHILHGKDWSINLKPFSSKKIQFTIFADSEKRTHFFDFFLTLSSKNFSSHEELAMSRVRQKIDSFF